MSHEIEAKIKVAALEPIADKLKQLEANFLYDIQQIDTHFMDAANQLRKSDCALRIRHQIIGGQSSAFMTFKGPRSDSKFKARPEYETGVANPEAAQRIFESLGYRKAIVVEKKRSMWSLDDCEVCLDKLPHLGCFVEVEGPGEEVITGVLEKLGLHNEPHISKGYAAMMSSELKQE
jgi:adenylate cyclase class 2